MHFTFPSSHYSVCLQSIVATLILTLRLPSSSEPTRLKSLAINQPTCVSETNPLPQPQPQLLSTANNSHTSTYYASLPCSAFQWKWIVVIAVFPSFALFVPVGKCGKCVGNADCCFRMVSSTADDWQHCSHWLSDSSCSPQMDIACLFWWPLVETTVSPQLTLFNCDIHILLNGFYSWAGENVFFGKASFVRASRLLPG